MRNLTVTIPDDAYRRARIRAAELGTSVSALVAEFLRSLSEEDAEFARLESLQQQVTDEITSFRGGERLDRAEVHDRAVR